MAGEFVEFEQITKQYEGQDGKYHSALKGISFGLNRGEIFGLMGPNGAGKSTLIKILLGLTKQSSGRVLIDGREINSHPEVKKLIGYVPEKVAFYGNLSALETLHFFSDLKGVSRKHCSEILERVGLDGHAKQRVGTFSKGMVQRVGVAQALLAKPEFLVFDEPTSGLDPLGVIQFKKLILELNKEAITVFFTSHILSEVEELAGRIGIINGGELRALDTLKALKAQSGLCSEMLVKFKNPVPELLSIVLGAGAIKAFYEKNVLRFSCSPYLKADILMALQAAGGGIMDICTIEPTLEEIYVQFLQPQARSCSLC